MGGELVIDIDACFAGAEWLAEYASEMDQAATAVKSEVADLLEDIDPMGFTSKLGVNSALATGKQRVHQSRLLVDDLSEFVKTNTTIAQQHDDDSASDFVTIGRDLSLEAGEYSAADYEQVTGDTRVRTAEDGAIASPSGPDLAA